jgi:hypothetical protein
LGIGFDDWEERIRDRFYSGYYIGKVYVQDASEVLSMGLQAIYESADTGLMFLLDPEHYALTRRMMRGIFLR